MLRNLLRNFGVAGSEAGYSKTLHMLVRQTESKDVLKPGCMLRIFMLRLFNWPQDESAVPDMTR
jgi:hypothetical protein